MRKKYDETIKYYDNEARGYTEKYYKTISPNSIRLNVILNRFKQMRCKTVLDAGCGSGYPVLRMLQEGFDAFGCDYSKEMVETSKNTLRKNGYNVSKIKYCNLEKEIPFKDDGIKFDGVMCHGPLMHVRDEKRLLINIYNSLNTNGFIMCEARNDLMSCFSMNEYSKRFFLKLIDVDKFPVDLKEDVLKFYNQFKGSNDSAPWKANFLTKMFNPFTINTLFESCGYTVIKLHFAHFHCLPPMFEKKYPELFKKFSLELENPDDWRGYLMASTFLVEAKKDDKG